MKDWCWSWNFNTLATWCEEPTHWKIPWHWERLKAGGEGDDRGWDGWMASLIWWTWVWVGSRSWWWTGKPGMLHSTGSQRVGHDWVTELNNEDKKFTHSLPGSGNRTSVQTLSDHTLKLNFFIISQEGIADKGKRGIDAMHAYLVLH